MSLPLRKDLDPKLTWDLNLLFKDQESFEKAIVAYQKDLQTISQYQGKLNQEKQLLSMLQLLEKIFAQLTWLNDFGFLGYEVDKNNPVYEENNYKLLAIYDETKNALSFIEVELANLDPNYLKSFVESQSGAAYQRYLDKIYMNREHVLSLEVESALSSINSQLFNQYRLSNVLKYQDLHFEDFTCRGKTYANTFAGFEGDYEVDLDPELRHAAWDSFHQGLAKYQNTAAHLYISHVQTEKAISKLRGYDSVIDYLLSDQEVSREAYDRQIDVIMTHLAPVMQRYAKLLAAKHGLSKISLADIKIPYSTQEPKKISIQASRQMIQDALSIFGSEYRQIIERAFEERWIDYPMNQSKSTGGFCSTVYQGPSYILLNWTGLLSEVLVLAHELGHAGHFQLSYQYQKATTPEASLYFIEAPSTANEVFMCHYLLSKDLDDEERANLVGEFISRTYFHNMVTHLLEADFQRKVYLAVDRGENLNVQKLNQFFKETLEQFWQEAVEINPGAELTWMRQPHHYMGLYSYTYSAGLTIGTQIGRKIANHDHETIQAWLDVLKAGGSMKPLDLAKAAGVDMSNDQALRDTIAYVDHLLDYLK